ncbi:MAG: hypothetical protein JXR56_07950, partial [Candidatus Cloacimonetes bacterium]|nr:hypothetical protein [Candidatus Cloacimonadota bacterium]
MKLKLLIGMLLITSVTLVAATADWTILVYMAADNGLSEAALSDIDEMERATPSGSVNIIVQADLSDVFNEDGRAYRYKIQHDEVDEVTSPIVGSLGEIDSGDWRT